ncbi:MAG: T9SS type A sorting domain-containing protein [Chitinophagales bacterium]
MRKIKCLLGILTVFQFSNAQTVSPQLISSSSGKGTISANYFEWSVGEPMVQTFSSATLIITQGFLQPTNALPTAIKNNTIASNELNLFPNPTANEIFLQTNFKEDGRLTYQLYDINGTLLLNNETELSHQLQSKIDISTLAVATYFLQVTFKTNQDEIKIASYKIQKISNQ